MIDPRDQIPLRISGTNFRGPVTVNFLDPNGQEVAPSQQAEVNEGGTRIAVMSPDIDSLIGLVVVTVEVVNSDNSASRSEATVRCELPSRTLDGSGNHPDNPALGSANTTLGRLVEPAYADGISLVAGPDRPSARTISNALFSQADDSPEPSDASAFLWQWGQFLDHDLSHTPPEEDGERVPVPVPAGDPWFDPLGSGEQTIDMTRSVYAPGEQPRQQLNTITAYIDGSNIYGSDEDRALALRRLDGSGQLKSSDGDLLPFNTEGLKNDGGSDDPELFVSGDVRANEQIGLTTMHILFMREHNRLAQKIADENPQFSGDEIYQAARRIVGAQIQAITYREFLPLLLGEDALPPYDGFDETADPTILNEFSTASYRFGHSLLSPRLLLLEADGSDWEEGQVALRNAFFNPQIVRRSGLVEALLRGLAIEPSQSLDAKLVDDVRNFLFGPPGAGGFDLASLNIQRGRDHGLPAYNDMREALGLGRLDSFQEFPGEQTTRNALASTYNSVDDIDLWVGGLAEQRKPGSLLGEFFHTILVRQFSALRDGDRFWYQALYKGRALESLESITLAEIIRRNTLIGDEISDDVFRVPDA
jgi:hypothetical protein